MPLTAGAERSSYPRKWLHLTLAVWGGSFFVLGGYPIAVLGRSLEWWFLLWLPLVVLSGASLSILLSRAVLRIERLHWSAQLFGILALLIPVSLAQAAIDHFLWGIFRRLSDPAYHPDPASGIGFNLLIYIWIFGLYVTGLKFLLLLQRARERDAEIARVRAAAGRAELAALRYQVQPDVLFTTLSSATEMVENGRPGEAAELIDRLSGFMRGQLAADAEGGTTLGAELDALDAFVALERTRSGTEIELDLDCPEELEELSGPAFLLQPLMEVRLRHVLEMPPETLHIRVTVTGQRNRLRLTVLDDGPSQPEADFAQVASRFRRLDMQDADLRIDTRGPFLAEFDLPLQ